jgi:hypothetical protein
MTAISPADYALQVKKEIEPLDPFAGRVKNSIGHGDSLTHE